MKPTAETTRIGELFDSTRAQVVDSWEKMAVGDTAVK